MGPGYHVAWLCCGMGDRFDQRTPRVSRVPSCVAGTAAWPPGHRMNDRDVGPDLLLGLIVVAALRSRAPADCAASRRCHLEAARHTWSQEVFVSYQLPLKCAAHSITHKSLLSEFCGIDFVR